MNRRSFLRSLFAAPVAAITAARLVQAEEPVTESLGRWTAVETPKPLVWHEGTLAEFNKILNRKENEFWRDQILEEVHTEGKWSAFDYMPRSAVTKLQL